ncbi:MAG: cytochrome b N-terminal domain-containing protein [bacterium]|nr:cytochrome b N-terminal domain-containing protein [bacterium]
MLSTLHKLKFELQQIGVVLGGLILLLFFLLIITGTLLSFFYNPEPTETYRSMTAIVDNPFTSFIRNLHFWSTDLFLFTLFLHMTRVALTKPSGRLRRYAWWIGVGLFIMVSTEMLLGTFLRGDHESLEAYSHFFLGVTGVVGGYFPFISVITDFFSGHVALFRFYIFHAIVIPFGILSLVVLHGLFAPTFRALLAPWKKATDAAIHGESAAEGLTPRPGLLALPSVRKLGMLFSGAIVAIVVLSLTLPAPFLTEPTAGIELTKPPWWLLWVYALENVWGLTPLAIAPPLLFGIYAIIPLLTKDRQGADLGVYLYLTTIAVLIALSFWAAASKPVAHTEHFVAEQAAHAH